MTSALMALAALPTAAGGGASIPLLLPDAKTHTKLVLQDEGLAFLRQVRGPVAVVSVVGAYRSGKSFLLNELMGTSCAEGFEVGHRREAQTKGAWISSTPRSLRPAGWSGYANVSLLYMDTEGFEGAGQAGVYDDRIFALAALLSSVLVYNLVEAIKQADIARLAFAVQLSQEFWRRAHQPALAGADPAADARGVPSDGRDSGGAPDTEWSPPALLWLVQRDFLEGGSVDSFLRKALTPTDEISAEPHAQELNRVRRSLRRRARTCTAHAPRRHASVQDPIPAPRARTGSRGCKASASSSLTCGAPSCARSHAPSSTRHTCAARRRSPPSSRPTPRPSSARRRTRRAARLWAARRTSMARSSRT